MNPKPPASAASPEPAAPPWWRVGMVWLVLGGPLVVVVAALVTVAIAVNGAEEVLTTPDLGAKGAQLPAVQARNHAATPRP